MTELRGTRPSVRNTRWPRPSHWRHGGGRYSRYAFEAAGAALLRDATLAERSPPGREAETEVDRLARDAAAVTDLLDLGVDEQIRVAALQRALAERLDLIVEQAGDPGHLALGCRKLGKQLPCRIFGICG